MVKHGLRKSKARFLIFFVVAALFACSLLPAGAAEEQITFELEDQEWTQTGDFFLEVPFVHEALPVESAANVNFYEAGNALETTFTVEKEAIYLITLGYVLNQDGGILEMKIDGTVIDSQINLNNGAGWEAGKKPVGLMTLSAGTHTLTFTSQESAYYCALLDYLTLEELTPSDEIVFEFAGNAYTKSDDFFLESNYTHEALPVDAVVNVDFYEAGRSLETVSLVVPQSGKYNVSLAYILNNDSCSVQIAIDGQEIGEPVNLYHNGGWTLEEQELGEIELAAGIHKITISSVDNGSGRFCARLDALKLSKTAEAEDPVDPEIPVDPDDQNPDQNPDSEKPNPSTGDSGLLLGISAAFLIGATAGIVIRRRKNNA